MTKVISPRVKFAIDNFQTIISDKVTKISDQNVLIELQQVDILLKIVSIRLLRTC